jgi:hypothetical protein
MYFNPETPVRTSNISLSVLYTGTFGPEGMVIENIIRDEGDTFTVTQDASRDYNVPKSAVEGFNGSEVYLSNPLPRFRSKKSDISPFLFSDTLC